VTQTAKCLLKTGVRLGGRIKGNDSSPLSDSLNVMRFSVLSIFAIVSTLASAGFSAAIPISSSIPHPVAALWKNQIRDEVNPKVRTVDSIAPREASSLAGEFDPLLERVAGATARSPSAPAPVGAIWKDRVHDQVFPTTSA